MKLVQAGYAGRHRRMLGRRVRARPRTTPRWQLGCHHRNADAEHAQHAAGDDHPTDQDHAVHYQGAGSRSQQGDADASAAWRGGPAPDCKVSDYKTVGNKVTWSMSCTGAAAASGTGEFVYTDDAYTGQMVMNVERGGQPMAVTMKYNGKRLGDCTK